MKITYAPIERMTLEEFADKHDLTLSITEQKTNKDSAMVRGRGAAASHHGSE